MATLMKDLKHGTKEQMTGGGGSKGLLYMKKITLLQSRWLRAPSASEQHANLLWADRYPLKDPPLGGGGGCSYDCPGW